MGRSMKSFCWEFAVFPRVWFIKEPEPKRRIRANLWHTFNARLLTVTLPATRESFNSDVNLTADLTRIHVHKENRPWGDRRGVQRGLSVRFHPLWNTSAGYKSRLLWVSMRRMWFINGAPRGEASTGKIHLIPFAVSVSAYWGNGFSVSV